MGILWDQMVFYGCTKMTTSCTKTIFFIFEDVKCCCILVWNHLVLFYLQSSNKLKQQLRRIGWHSDIYRSHIVARSPIHSIRYRWSRTGVRKLILCVRKFIIWFLEVERYRRLAYRYLLLFYLKKLKHIAQI